MVNILVEGPDCSGKSTLVKSLKNKLGWDAKFLGHKDCDQFTRYLQEYSQNEIIFERGHISEIVYGKLFRDEEPFTEVQQRILESVCSQQTLQIFCTTDLELMIERNNQRPPPEQHNDLTEQHQAFTHIFSKYGSLVQRYNATTYDALEQFVERMHQKINAFEGRTW